MQIVLPPAVARSSFQDAFSVFKEFNKVQWSAMPLETLYDTSKIIQDWDQMGFKVWKTPKLQELPSLVEPETAYPRSALVMHLFYPTILISMLLCRATVNIGSPVRCRACVHASARLCWVCAVVQCYAML